MKILAPKTK